MGGPLFFFMLYGTFLLLSGKVHFGFIYGLAALGSVILHFILSLMSPVEGPSTSPTYPGQPTDPASAAPNASSASSAGHPGGHLSSTLTFPRSASVLGYCLLPLVATSLVGVAMRMDTPVGIIITSLAIMWSTFSASGMFCAAARMPRGMRALVAYPLALFYVGFGIMGVFSSNGSGSLAKVAATGA